MIKCLCHYHKQEIEGGTWLLLRLYKTAEIYTSSSGNHWFDGNISCC
jgi:hypothetical protein